MAITEVMFDPAGPEPAGEWFEVWNGTSGARSLAGLTLRDGAGRVHVIAGEMGEVAVGPNQYAVLVRDRDAAVASGVPEGAIIYAYGTADGAALSAREGIQLSNGGNGAIALLDGDAEIASVAYGALRFTDVEGRSAQADDRGEWVLAPATPGAGPAPTR